MLIGAGIGIPFQQNVLARLLGSAEFQAQLTHSAVPVRAASGTTATFTRATTSTWPNNDGYLVTGVAGEIGFPGARRIRSYISASSEDFSNAAWTKLSTTVVVNQAAAPNGTLTADLVHPASSGTDRAVYQNGLVSTVVGDKMILEIYAKYAGIKWLWFGTLGGGTAANQLPFFDLQNGVVGQAGTYFDSSDIEDVGNGWYRCSAVKNTIPVALLFPVYGFGDADGSTTVTANGTDGLYLWGAQVEDVTAQTTQTAGEYVSVGVESAPYYHGSMVDGVKCFPTDLSGNPIPAATMLGYQAEGARTNHFLQSGTPATQTSGSLSTGTYTLWMDGTGSIAVAGATATITGAGTATSSTAVTFVVTVAGTVTYTVTGSPTRAQSENGAQRSSYIATTTIAVTRNADVLTYSSAGNTSASAGWVYVEATVPINNGAPQIQIDDGSSDNRILIDDGNSANGGTRFFIQSGGAVQANIGDFSSSANIVQKRCVTWAANYAQSSQGGLLSAADTSVTTPVSFTQIGVGGANGVAVAPCTIRNVRIGQRQLSASELGAITS